MKNSYHAGFLLVVTLGLAGLGYFFADKNIQPAAVLIRSSNSSTAVKQPALPDIEKSLTQREYHVTFDPEKRKFQSPNRQHNLRAYYEPGVLTVRNRKDSAGHNFEFKLINQGVYADGKRMDLADKRSKVENSDNTVEIRHSAFTEEYINSPEGIRQNFIIGEAPAGTNELAVKLELKGFEAKETGTNELVFYRSYLAGKSRYELTYNGLKCWDATGMPLDASLTYQNARIQISVDVRGAAYPVTIDPIITNGNPGNAIKVPDVNQAQAGMGQVVSSAGDVNGDGYSDVIVGAYKYDNGQVDEGAAFLYYGSAGGINMAGPVMLQSDQKDAKFGCYASSAGDINRDGFGDIIVSSFLYDKGQTNEGAAFVYYGSAQGISTTASVILESNQAEAYMGNRVGLAGDVNGDGYSDILVCASAYDKGQTNEGVVFLYHGSAAGLNANSPVIIEANQAEAAMGFCASGAGDVNGDGYSDIIVGARGYDKGQTDEGAVFVYHGSALGINPNNAATILESNQAGAFLGHSAATAGDVNGDGYSDIIAGAIMYDKGQTNEGAAFVHYGSAQGISVAANQILEMNQAEAQFGGSVASAGDVNGDGYADVIVGAMFYDNGQSNEGAAFVYQGGKNGFFSTLTFESDQAGAQFGSSVSSAGDVNGDGYSDVIVGAIFYDNGQLDEGGAFVWLGKANGIDMVTASSVDVSQVNCQMAWSVAGVGDLNADGYGDMLVGAPMYDNGQSDEGAVFVYYGRKEGIGVYITHDLMLESNQANAGFGKSVSTGGDINGDGYDDVIIGSIYYSNGELYEGAAYIYYGSQTGLQKNLGSILESNQANALMGRSVASAGDINRDGFDDIIVGAEAFDNGQFNEGVVFIYHGTANGINTQYANRIEGDQETAYMGYSVAGGGDVNGDGFDDVAVGLPWYSNGQVREGLVQIYYGSGNGINTNLKSSIEANIPDGTFGWCISIAGDINADGYTDVVIGAPSSVQSQFDQGAVFTFLGSAFGIQPSPSTTMFGEHNNARFGESVASAGDVDGDGYSDIIVGAPQYRKLVVLGGIPKYLIQGKVFLYRGSPPGLITTAFATFEAGHDGTKMGQSVSGAGDINGDGYSDMIMGAPGFNDGTAFIAYGNIGYNLKNNLRLYNTNLATPINQTQLAQNNFGAGLYAKSFLGGNKGKLVWETKPAGQGFSKGANNVITNSTQSSGSQNAYTSLGLLGMELKNIIAKQGPATKVRVRIKYDPALALTGQTYGPWRYLSSYLTGSSTAPVPEEGMQETITKKATEKNEGVEKVRIFPNPVTDRLFIDDKQKSGIASVQVLSTMGRTVYASIKAEREIDLSGIHEGVYVLIVRYADGSQSSHKVTVKR